RQQKTERVPGDRRRRGVRVLRAVFGVLVLGLALWAVFAARRNRRWDAYLGRLASEPGVVVTGVGRRGGKYFVSGLRDPLAADPVALLDGSGFSREDVASDWKPYQALTPGLIAARARYLLEAPETVTLAVRDGALVASGSASNRWIEEARARSRLIVGISRYDDRGLIDADSTELEDLRRRIEARVPLFALGSAELSPAQEERIRETAADLKELARLATRLDRRARLEVVGRGDSVGTEDVNLGISRRRADRGAAALRPEEIAGLTVTALGLGSARPLRAEVTEKDRELNRSVSFRVVLADRPEKESQRR
ncbi:MAG: OmpA family protein, partial [Acidobacteriota bacterium]